MLFVAGESGYLLFKERKKNSRLESNIKYGYQTGFNIVDYYKAKNGQLVARNAVLEYSSKELRNGIVDDVLKALENLGIKPKFVTNYSNTVIQHEKEILVPTHDSIIFDTIHAECFTYNDKFYNINGLKIGDRQQLKIASVDSLIQVTYRGKRYNRKGVLVPGIFFWIPRRLEQVISSNNPNSKITYCKTISIVK